MKILLTGFEPFGDLKVNPSQAILERITDGHTLCNIACDGFTFRSPNGSNPVSKIFTI